MFTCCERCCNRVFKGCRRVSDKKIRGAAGRFFAFNPPNHQGGKEISRLIDDRRIRQKFATDDGAGVKETAGLIDGHCRKRRINEALPGRGRVTV